MPGSDPHAFQGVGDLVEQRLRFLVELSSSRLVAGEEDLACESEGQPGGQGRVVGRQGKRPLQELDLVGVGRRSEHLEVRSHPNAQGLGHEGDRPQSFGRLGSLEESGLPLGFPGQRFGLAQSAEEFGVEQPVGAVEPLSGDPIPPDRLVGGDPGHGQFGGPLGVGEGGIVEVGRPGLAPVVGEVGRDRVEVLRVEGF